MKRILEFTKAKYTLLKSKFKTIPTTRNSDELFQSGGIFNASEEELKNVLKEASMKAVPNELVRHREIVRALVVNNIQNQRHIDKIDSRNQVYTAIIIGLTIINIWLAQQQANYSEISTRAERITQERSIQDAINACKQNPQLKDSGLYDTSNGTSATCTDVLKTFSK